MRLAMVLMITVLALMSGMPPAHAMHGESKSDHCEHRLASGAAAQPFDAAALQMHDVAAPEGATAQPDACHQMFCFPVVLTPVSETGTLKLSKLDLTHNKTLLVPLADPAGPERPPNGKA